MATMKFATLIPAGIGTGICALALTSSAVIGGASAASAATLAPHAAAQTTTSQTVPAQTTTSQTPAESMTAWLSGPGYGYLTGTEAAEAARDGAALTREATLAAEYPQPVGTAGYIATMRVYAAAGQALTRGDTSAATADLAQADDMAWDVIKATFGALDRIPLNG
jgi:hypothetical protein